MDFAHMRLIIPSAVHSRQARDLGVIRIDGGRYLFRRLNYPMFEEISPAAAVGSYLATIIVMLCTLINVPFIPSVHLGLIWRCRGWARGMDHVLEDCGCCPK